MALGKLVLIGGIGVVLAVAVIVPAIVLSLPSAPKADALMGDDFFRVRHEALDLFPRGSRVVDVAGGLMAIGFRCVQVPHKMANINAESLTCDSHGRGYPRFGAMTITVLARNGLLSDIEVWNMLRKADAETLPQTPEPVKHEPVTESPHG